MTKEPLSNNEMLNITEDFEKAYRTHSSAIYKFIFWRTKDTHLAEGLTSRTFEKAWVSRRSFHGGSSRAWLYRIANNVLIDYWRKKKDIPIDDTSNLTEDTQSSTAEILDKKQQIKQLQTALNKLPEQMHEILKLRFIEGLSSKQVAERLNLSESNIRVIQYRALKKMKEFLR